jgi:ABC-type glycerol-3-phosphate transport system permease component
MATALPPKTIVTDRDSATVDVERYARAAKRAEVTMRVLRALLWSVLLGGVVFAMLPLWIMLMMALKTPQEISATSAWSWPKNITFQNFQEVLTNPNAPFITFFQNTVLIAVPATIGVVLTSAMVAYPFARLRFRGRDRLFILLLSTMMLPGVVTMIPTYVMYAQVAWVNTLKPLIIPAFFGGGAFNIFLLRQFFMGIPRDLDEAAILDGASHATIFWRVILPNAGAALATVGVFCFIGTWRDFMGPLLYLNSPDMQTLEVGLRTYQSLQSEQWHLLMAGSVIVMIPLFVIFLIGQKYFVKGIVMSGLK